MDLYFFGGSFDPPHLGHKEIINHFIDKSDMFVVCPSYKSPFKNSGPIGSFLQRKKMLEMMILPNKKLSIIDYEFNNKVSKQIIIKFSGSKILESGSIMFLKKQMQPQLNKL